MSSPRGPSSASSILNDKAKLSVLVAQFIIDLPSLDAGTLATLSKIAEGPDNDPLPVGTVTAYLQKYPNRIRSIVGPAMPAMPYHKLFMPFEIFEPEYILHEIGDPVLKILGETRFHLCMMSLHERWSRLGAPPRSPTGKMVSDHLKAAPLPDMAQVEAALEKFGPNKGSGRYSAGCD